MDGWMDGFIWIQDRLNLFFSLNSMAQITPSNIPKVTSRKTRERQRNATVVWWTWGVKSQMGWRGRTLPGSLQHWQGWHCLIRIAFYTLFVLKHFSGFVNRQLFPKADRAKDFHIDSCIEFIECINRGMSCILCDGLRLHNDPSLTMALPQSEAWADNQRSSRANLTEQQCVHEGLHATQAK